VKVVYLGPVAPHWEVHGVFGGGRLIDEFRQRALARLQLLPPHDSQFRRNREGVARDAERERLIVEWDLGYEEPETAQPGLGGSRAAALPASPSHALPVPGEPCAVGERWLRAFSLA
jgi:hypothetical protein